MQFQLALLNMYYYHNIHLYYITHVVTSHWKTVIFYDCKFQLVLKFSLAWEQTVSRLWYHIKTPLHSLGSHCHGWNFTILYVYQAYYPCCNGLEILKSFFHWIWKCDVWFSVRHVSIPVFIHIFCTMLHISNWIIL